VAVGLPPAERPSESEVVAEALEIGQGRHVVHVRVRGREGGPASGVAWEAILAAGRDEPLFAGITGLSQGDPGERTGVGLQVLPAAPPAPAFVVIGDLREDLRLCGQAQTLLDPRALYPSSLSFRPATVQRLSADRRESAEPIQAKDVGGELQPALGRLLVARGSSASASRGLELTDGDPATAWTETRPGIGQGEFVVMAAPRDVPVSRLEVALVRGAGAAVTAPKTFYLVTDTETFAVTLPDMAARTPGEVFEVNLPKPVATSCLALVLSDAFAEGRSRPQVGLGELVAYSEFDGPGASLDDVAKALSGERGAAAAQVLERAGPGALRAVARAYDGLDARGRARAVDVAASAAHCEDASALLVRAMCETDGEAPRRAREKLERCPAAAAALAQTVREDPVRRACAAPLLSTLAPSEALVAIADALAAAGEADREGRRALRAAFGAALDGVRGGPLVGGRSPPPPSLGALLADPGRPASARLEVMRAAGEGIAQAPAESQALLAELGGGTPSFRVRYLVLEPLAILARRGDAAATGRIGQAMAHDPDAAVRARAAELSVGVAGADGARADAERDADPRVREAALAASLGSAPPVAAVRGALDLLPRERWSFVKTQAIRLLAGAPSGDGVDSALIEALSDASMRVRGAAVAALAQRHALGAREALRRRLEDDQEDADVRASAATALGELCDDASLDALTAYAARLGALGTDQEGQQLALAAVAGLAALHPSDLRARLAPLLASSSPPYARAAAERALASRRLCR
jgi:hypothetical protein